MSIRVEVRPRERNTLISQFYRLVGLENLRRCVANIDREFKQAPVLGEYLTERRSVEVELIRLADYRRNTGRLPKASATNMTYTAMAFAVAFVRVHDKLSGPARRKLLGRFSGALRGGGSLTPLWHELSAVVHLSQRGWHVRFADFEGEAPFDFLAMKQGVEVEVECKAVSADRGRKIHRVEFRRLTALLHDDLLKILGAREGIRFVRLEVADRLPTNTKELHKIGESVCRIVDSGNDVVSEQYHDLALEIHDFDMDQRKMDAAVADFCERSIRYPNSHHSYIVGSKRSMCLVSITSKKPDRVLAYIYKQLKQANRQFSKKRAGTIIVNFEDITSEQWGRLRSGSGLQIMTSHFLNGIDRRHICALAYNSSSEIVDSGKYTRQIGDALNYVNKNCTFINPIFQEIFGTA